jgi:hypothetical protein
MTGICPESKVGSLIVSKVPAKVTLCIIYLDGSILISNYSLYEIAKWAPELFYGRNTSQGEVTGYRCAGLLICLVVPLSSNLGREIDHYCFFSIRS